jgi:hypothetical protein
MSTAEADRRPRLPGILLLASGALSLAALALVPAWPVITAPPATALDIVTDVREWYQLAGVLGELTGITALAGVLALAAVVVPAHPTAAGRTAAVAGSGTLALGIVVWIVAHTIQVTNLLMSNAQGGTATDLSYLVLAELGHVLCLAAFTTIAAGLALTGFGLRRNPAVRSWAAWLAWGGAGAVAILVAVVHDVPSFAVFLVILPALGVAALSVPPAARPPRP